MILKHLTEHFLGTYGFKSKFTKTFVKGKTFTGRTNEDKIKSFFFIIDLKDNRLTYDNNLLGHYRIWIREMDDKNVIRNRRQNSLL